MYFPNYFVDQYQPCTKVMNSYPSGGLIEEGKVIRFNSLRKHIHKSY